MNDQQKAELRRLAEAANRTGMEWPGASEFANQLPSEADYCEVATPAAVLSLLDENEALTKQVAALQSAENSWQSGYDKGREMGAKHRSAEVEQLRAEVEALQRDAGRYQWLCEHFGVTKLPCAVERILAGDIYVADGKAGVDVAIDAAMAKEPGAK